MSSINVPVSPKLLKFLDILEDGQWHDISEIVEQLHVEAGKIRKVCDILVEFELVERKGEKVKLLSVLPC